MKKKNGLRRFLTLDVHNHEGFTLVELIVVIAILGILAGVAVPVYSGYVKKANLAADQTLVDSINTAFAAACIENVVNIGDDTVVNADTAKLGIDPTTKQLTCGDADLVNADVTESFRIYFGGNASTAFKEMKGLRFDESLDRFVESTRESTFDRPGVMAGIWNAFNSISDSLSTWGTLPPATIEAGLKNDFSDVLAGALGMDDMIDGYIDATALDNDILDDYLRSKIDGYDELDDTAKAAYRNRYKANLGVMYFADEANNGDPNLHSNVMTSLGKIVGATRNAGSVEAEDVWAYYCSTPRGQQQGADPNNMQLDNTDFQDFMNNTSSMLGLNGGQLAAIDKAIKQEMGDGTSVNSAGVNTLGALYAMSAGYFNNTEYWPDGPEGMDIGAFPTVVIAMSQPNFAEYFEKQAGVDVNSYLEKMAQLSGDKNNLDLSKDDVFSGLIG